MDRKTEIIEAAARIIGNEGNQAFTTKHLAATIGISEATLYRHYSGKNELVHKVFEHYESVIGIKIASIVDSKKYAKTQINQLFDLHKEVFQEYPELVFLLFSVGSFIDVEGLGERIREILERKFKPMEVMIKQSHESGTIRPDISAYEMGKVIMGYFRLYLLQLRLEGNMKNLDKYCANFFTTFNQLH